MIRRTLGIGGPLLLGAAYVSGVFGGGAYSRVVAKPQAEVMAGLADLDITSAPGEPGTDPSRAGGIRPVIHLTQAADRMTWTVMSGQQIATQMTAILEPLDGGRTKVSAVVERGDAPDDFTSPAFRSEALTMALFAMVLEDELNALTLPKHTNAATCDRMRQELIESGALASPGMNRGENLSTAIAGGAKVIMKLQAAGAELRRQGCDTGFNQDFGEVSDRMSKGDHSIHPAMRPPERTKDETVSFEPGKPMTDLSQYD